MPAEQQITSKLFGGDGNPVRCFTGDKRLASFRCDSFDLAACGTGNHPDTSGNFRSNGDLFHWPTYSSFQPSCKLARKNVHRRSSTRERSFLLKEWLGIFNSQGSDQHDALLHFVM